MLITQLWPNPLPLGFYNTHFADRLFCIGQFQLSSTFLSPLSLLPSSHTLSSPRPSLRVFLLSPSLPPFIQSPRCWKAGAGHTVDSNARTGQAQVEGQRPSGGESQKSHSPPVLLFHQQPSSSSLPDNGRGWPLVLQWNL